MKKKKKKNNNMSMLYCPVKSCSSNELTVKFIVWNGVLAFGCFWNTHKVLNSKVYLEWGRVLPCLDGVGGLNGVWNRMGSYRPTSEHLCQIYWSVTQGPSCLSGLNQFLLPRSSTYKKDIMLDHVFA